MILIVTSLVLNLRLQAERGFSRLHETIRQVCKELRVRIVSGVLSKDHMFVEIPPHISVSQFVQRAKADRHAKYNRPSQSSVKHIGAENFGHEDTSAQQAGILRMM